MLVDRWCIMCYLICENIVFLYSYFTHTFRLPGNIIIQNNVQLTVKVVLSIINARERNRVGTRGGEGIVGSIKSTYCQYYNHF